ncbi:hypothetical protein M430DRAFT_58998 [Amorphotheca resinae ATCC 22711]|uniref:Uncharacterized protein n=1 Tax=Amorphotheca resinae ATCC 22711 TaxID=857342 RepID=A0A2T3AZG2_AMORE|nr:hypothetical protein M430DRAFT_58998 [Amorphotheca resinae ATCC 22711]PSS16522.1 hypothetical protein M430DRAFT_58998 [Amorphotheca resinae ATCC 22711]
MSACRMEATVDPCDPDSRVAPRLRKSPGHKLPVEMVRVTEEKCLDIEYIAANQIDDVLEPPPSYQQAVSPVEKVTLRSHDPSISCPPTPSFPAARRSLQSRRHDPASRSHNLMIQTSRRRPPPPKYID